MSYAYSLDQTTIIRRYADLPAKHWVQDTDDAGHYELLTVDNAASFGYYPIDESAVRPADTPTTTWDVSWPFVTDQFVKTWTERAKTATELDNDDRETKRTTVGNSVDTLRQWALDAQSTSVTNGNNNNVTQTMVDRLGVFFDRFADLIEAQRLDQ